MNRIPKTNRDLTWYILRRDLLRILGFLLWVGALYLGVRSYNTKHHYYPAYRLILGWRLALFLAIAVVSGILIFRMWRLFTDRTFAGVIETSSLSHSYNASSDPGKGGDYDFRLNTVLTVRTVDGKMRRIRFEQKKGFYQYYHEGNRILHLHGLPYPVNLDTKAKNGCVCSACGTHFEKPTSHCDTCRHSLIDPHELDL